MFKKKSILITGGTGSFGKAFILDILKKKLFRRIIVFSIDELKQFEMKQSAIINENKNKNLRYLIGDVRDKNRLMRAFENVDYVVHAAALKQVPTSEYNPFETINTNIIGAQNVIDSALATNVKLLLSQLIKHHLQLIYMEQQNYVLINYCCCKQLLRKKENLFFSCKIRKCNGK